MNPIIKKIVQLGIITDDRDAMVKKYNDEYGIGPWFLYTFPNGNKLGVCDALNIQLEVVEPAEGTYQREWLNIHGPGIQHIATNVNPDYLPTKQRLIDGGNNLLWTSKDPTGSECSFINGNKNLGMTFELYDREEGWQPPTPNAVYPPDAVFTYKP
ncbi:MAG: VOC family protein [Oscillospiraceae bacterium]|nr:VOC family protein [Oscillospiraceae bacterium]